MRLSQNTYIYTLFLFVAVLLAVLAVWFGLPVFPFGLCGYFLVALVPGAAIYRWTAKEPELLQGATAAVALSPVPVTAIAMVLMLADVPSRETVTVILVLTGLVAGMAIRCDRPGWRLNLVGTRQVLLLLGLLLVVAAAIGFLPATREWWRMRSDAWFHGAVVAQISDFGVPPDDPYMFGFPLQYMWFYHVYVVVLSRVSGLSPLVLMPLVNLHAVTGFALASFLFSSIFRKAFSFNFAAMLTVLFGMNAAFWVFLPVKLLRAFFGEVRGMADVTRILSLEPFDLHTVRSFVAVGFNQEFTMDKFMVATAFSMGLCLMTVLWWAAAEYVVSHKREHLVAAFLAAFGVVAFHTALGVVVFGGVAGGLFLLIVLKRYFNGYDRGPVLRLFLALVLCGVLLLPYVYSVVHAKTGGEAVPIGLSGSKMIGIVVSCALVIFLALFQARRLFRTRDAKTYFLLLTTAAVVFICTILNLPGANSYDKFPFLVFLPLAVVGGWTLAEFSERARTTRGRVIRFVLVCIIAFAPLNVFMFAGYYNTPPTPALSQDEINAVEWARAETPRDAIMIDSKVGGFLLVTCPRRYYFAGEGYAVAWGYDQSAIDERRSLKENIYLPGMLENETLMKLGAMPHPTYIFVRSDAPEIDSKKLEPYTDLFKRVYTNGPFSVFEVDRKACADVANRQLLSD